MTSSGKPLEGIYAQYDKKGKHWYAPNKFEAYGDDEIDAVVDCLKDGFLAPGPRTEMFEKKVAGLFGKKVRFDGELRFFGQPFGTERIRISAR